MNGTNHGGYRCYLVRKRVFLSGNFLLRVNIHSLSQPANVNSLSLQEKTPAASCPAAPAGGMSTEQPVRRLSQTGTHTAAAPQVLSSRAAGHRARSRSQEILRMVAFAGIPFFFMFSFSNRPTVKEPNRRIVKMMHMPDAKTRAVTGGSSVSVTAAKTTTPMAIHMRKKNTHDKHRTCFSQTMVPHGFPHGWPYFSGSLTENISGFSSGIMKPVAAIRPLCRDYFLCDTGGAGCVPGRPAGEQDHPFHKSYYPRLPSICYTHAGSRHTGTSSLPFREYGPARPGTRDGERPGIPSRQN